MRHSATLLRVLAAVALGLAVAEPNNAAAQTGCEAKRQACIAECRAQHFAIDPKRTACIASCESEANRCMRERAQAGRSATTRLHLASCRMSLDDRSSPTAGC